MRDFRHKGTKVLAAGVTVLFMCCVSAWINVNQDVSGSKVLQQYSTTGFQFSGPAVPNEFQATGAAEYVFAGNPASDAQQSDGYGQAENVLAPGPAISSEFSIQPQIAFKREMNVYPQYQYGIYASPAAPTSWYQFSPQPAVESVSPQPSVWPSFTASALLPKQVLQQHDINQWLRQKRLAIHPLTREGLDAPRQSTRLAVEAALISAQALKAAAAANQTLKEVSGTK
jgi:hypothetical protein